MLDLALTLAVGGDCLSDIALLRAEPGLYGHVASDPTVSRTIDALAADAPTALAAINTARAAVWARAWEAVRYGLGEHCHARALAEHTAQPVDLSAALRAAVDAAQARAAEAARQAQAAVAAPHDLDPARPAAPVLPLPRRPDRPAHDRHRGRPAADTHPTAQTAVGATQTSGVPPTPYPEAGFAALPPTPEARTPAVRDGGRHPLREAGGAADVRRGDGRRRRSR